MKIRCLILTLLLICVVSELSAQDIVVIDGAKYTIHDVVKGETLYSLARKRGTTVDEIVKANDALAEGLKAGQRIKIPFCAEPKHTRQHQGKNKEVTQQQEVVPQQEVAQPVESEMVTSVADSIATSTIPMVEQASFRTLREGDKAGFYDEVLKALWGYLGDKLSMPVSELSKDNISTKLADRQVPETLVEECLVLVGECEFARYAPSLSNASEAQIYDKVNALMDELENAIRR